jgi:hypothetical protein
MPKSTRIDPDCVKTCTRGECAELFSLFSPFDGACQSGSFLIQRNRNKRSTRKFDVGVFTQPGPRADFDPSPVAAIVCQSAARVVGTPGRCRDRRLWQAGTGDFGVAVDPNGATGLREHRRSPPVRCKKPLRRLGQWTKGGRPRRSNRSVWSGFRPDMSEGAWQQPSSCAFGDVIQSATAKKVPRRTIGAFTFMCAGSMWRTLDSRD